MPLGTPSYPSSEARQDETTKTTLQQLLKDNHDTLDITYHGYFANHTVHHLYALYTLGADSERLKHCLAKHKEEVGPLPPPKVAITADNWRDHFSNTKMYSSYLRFFEAEVARLGPQKAFDYYVPELIVGMVGAAAHPLIHLGFALEFNNTTVLAEALAFGCARRIPLEPIVDRTAPAMIAADGREVSFSTAIAQVAGDARLDKVPYRTGRLGDKMRAMFDLCGDEIAELTNSVLITQDNVDDRMHELFDAAVTAYGGCAQRENPDFFLAHGLTGAHAMRIVGPHLSAKERVRLVRSHWLFLVAAYIAQGRPGMDLATVIQRYTDDKAYPWSKVMSSALSTDDEHVPKVVHAMREAEKTWGARDGKWRAIAALTVDKIKATDDWVFKATEHD
ncbi:hypothetical protein THASP1DRAFT_14538 [Thamnocephalis sphaerospora]|uniref:Oxidoreductase AflY n=1 Tax=Thamnocephalis sphaerospora TaxID=78915 RepID=A0A4P9XSW7_9FUNG|nr:hypothetical protein THASP1DRAFT_14538 [Thamnocephalis sphaerospora]|eukprot:RKP09233.1 hypothetical protein THASP1DRAFT_14538 [Thamnocephalis sphaerospora]